MGVYEREWTTNRDLPPGQRILFGLTTEEGLPIRLLCQLEYNHEGDWLPVARFDHDTDGPSYRNIERAGLHMDVLDPEGQQIHKKTDFPPVDLRHALAFAEGYLRAHRQQLIRRFERDL
jgi:hypothetical protein